MEAVRQVIDSSLLDGIISLPRDFQNTQVEIFVFKAKEEPSLPQFTISEIDAMLKGSLTESIVGVIPDDGTALEEYRTERLGKYESFN
ncbi:MAG: hypothetical protein LBS19_03060 [Clostridiales bacterium]|jgi:hypothetical protein|nr:hypothetical protein [Clostridiales bacterium]